MSNLNHPGYNPTPKAKLKLQLPVTMNELVYTIVATQKGWLIRQAIKYATLGGTALTTWLVTQGVAITDGSALGAALATVASGVLELALSKLASKIAAK